MKKRIVTRWKRPLAAALGALFVFGAVSGAGSALPESVKDALPEGVREVLTPVTAQAAGGDAAIVMGTASVLGETGDYNQDHTNTQIVRYGGQSWYVIGYDGNGVAQTANSDTMTLISVGNLETEVQFNPDPSAAGANHYGGSTLKSKVDVLASTFSSGEQKAVIPRTLDSGTYNTTEPWETDCVAGSQVTDAILWPLSTKEANAMNANLRQADPANPGWATSYWWLRSPGYYDIFRGECLHRRLRLHSTVTSCSLTTAFVPLFI
ncbi:MAG: hypothetical protein IJR00_09825 [Lachnospiraceae bacterium]|nr:hypothetical protein [Lachnospiraceae bacterium]